MAGLTNQGFVPKTRDEIKEDMESKLRAYFGDDINLDVGSRFGTLVDIFSFEVSDVWLALQADYNSRFRSTATFMNLDYVGSLTNSVRKYESQSSVSCFLGGPKSNVTLPSGLRVQVSGGDTRQFSLDTTATITANDYLIVGDTVANNPTGGVLVFSWENTLEIVINLTDNAATIASTIQTALGLAPGDITVVGDLQFNGALHITFNATNNTIGLPIISENTTLARFSKPVNFKTGYATNNSESFTGIESTADAILPRSIQSIASNDSNFTLVINYQAGTPGSARETDDEFRARMEDELQAQGTATRLGFQEQIASLTGVDTVNIVENNTDEPDNSGRPPHSIEVFVDGGSDDAVAQAIYSYKPLGIRNTNTTTTNTAASRTGAITTANGQASTLSFSSSLQVNVYAAVTTVVDSSYPVNGDLLIKEAIADYINDVGLGQILYTYKLYGAVAAVPGVVNVEIKVGTSPSSLLSANIVPESFQRLVSSENIISIEGSSLG